MTSRTVLPANLPGLQSLANLIARKVGGDPADFLSWLRDLSDPYAATLIYNYVETMATKSCIAAAHPCEPGTYVPDHRKEYDGEAARRVSILCAHHGLTRSGGIIVPPKDYELRRIDDRWDVRSDQFDWGKCGRVHATGASGGPTLRNVYGNVIESGGVFGAPTTLTVYRKENLDSCAVVFALEVAANAVEQELEKKYGCKVQ